MQGKKNTSWIVSNNNNSLLAQMRCVFTFVLYICNAPTPFCMQVMCGGQLQGCFLVASGISVIFIHSNWSKPLNYSHLQSS